MIFQTPVSSKIETMNKLLLFLIVAIAFEPAIKAQSTLLESVKRNPAEARALCNKFKSLNSRGISSSSKEVIEEISIQKNLSELDAEILTIYVIGMHCPEVK